jgi:hypothetical protein
MNDLETSAQEQHVYKLTEDDDAPLLTVDEEVKFEAKECVKGLFTRFNNMLEALLCDPVESANEKEKMQSFQSYLSHLSLAC